MQLLQQMNVAMSQGAPAPQLNPTYAPQTQPEPQPQPQPVEPIYPDINTAAVSPEEYNKKLAEYLSQRDKLVQQQVMQQVQQLAAPLMRNNALMARQNVASDKEYADVFERYGPEVDLVLQENNVPIFNRTIEAYRMAADVVRGRHFRELAQEEARKLAGQAHAGTIRGGVTPTGTAPSSGDALDKLWATEHPYVKSAKGNRLTKEDVRRAIKEQGHTVDSFVKLLDSNNMFIAPDGKHITMRTQHNE